MQLQRSFSSCQERSLVGFLGPARAFSDSVSLLECVYFEKSSLSHFVKTDMMGENNWTLYCAPVMAAKSQKLVLHLHLLER